MTGPDGSWGEGAGSPPPPGGQPYDQGRPWAPPADYPPDYPPAYPSGPPSYPPGHASDFPPQAPPPGYGPPGYQPYGAAPEGYGAAPYPPVPTPYGSPAGGYGPPSYQGPGGYSGYPGPYFATAPSTTNNLAIASLATSIAGLVLGGPLTLFCFVGIVIPIVGLALGIVALNQIKTTQQSGRGMAIAGIAISGATLALIIIGVLIAVVAANT